MDGLTIQELLSDLAEGSPVFRCRILKCHLFWGSEQVSTISQCRSPECAYRFTPEAPTCPKCNRPNPRTLTRSACPNCQVPALEFCTPVTLDDLEDVEVEAHAKSLTLEYRVAYGILAQVVYAPTQKPTSTRGRSQKTLTKEVLALLAEGMSVKDVATQLDLSYRQIYAISHYRRKKYSGGHNISRPRAPS